MKINAVEEKHPFKSFVPANAGFLIVGSFPTRRKIWKIPWYYGSRYSQFWKILESVYSIKLSTLSKIKILLKREGIGITDAVEICRRLKNNSSDQNLKAVKFRDVAAVLKRHKNIKKVFFTSLFAKKSFLKGFGSHYIPRKIDFVLLPSPSPRNARLTINEKSRIYGKMLAK